MNFFLRYNLCQIQGIRRNGGVCGCVPESLFDLVKRIIQVGIVYTYYIFVLSTTDGIQWTKKPFRLSFHVVSVEV